MTPGSGRAWMSGAKPVKIRAQDAVVSIHADGGPPSGRGFHVAYSWPPLDPD